MNIVLEPKSRVPLFRQLAQALLRTFEQGTLQAGHRLPSSRALAKDLKVSRLTVENAYGLLESEGHVERRHGSGTYLLPSYRPPASPADEPVRWPTWQTKFTPGAKQGHSPAKARGSGSACFDFSSGLGDGGLLPVREFLKSLRKVLRRDGAGALGYAPAQGLEALRVSLAELLSAQGLPARAENILVTLGSQQALSLCAQALLKPGDTVLVEDPCYDAALSLFRLLGLRIQGLPMDQDGLVVERLEPLLRRSRPGLLYCMPNYQNPSGCVLPVRRRRLLVALAERYHFPILEDDYVGELRYEGNALPSLKALAPPGCVLYTSTFSKLLMPGLRLGYLLAEGPVLHHLCLWKRNTEISNASLLQRALQSFISVGRLRRHVHRARLVYRARREAMIAGLRAHFPRECVFSIPRGGLFLWLRLPA